ncbi:MAG: sigma-70 family RNA polymerase sigma factor [bacterium]
MEFEVFYKSTFKTVYSYFYNKFVNVSDIEDLAQESFLRIYSKYGDNFPNTDEPRKILFGICRNIYRDWVRDHIKEVTTDDIETAIYKHNPDYNHEEDFEDDSQDLIRQQNVDLVKEAMKKLNPKVKAVLEYRFIEGLSRKEIAEKLGISQDDVHTYQKRGIKYLNKMINTNDKVDSKTIVKKEKVELQYDVDLYSKPD